MVDRTLLAAKIAAVRDAVRRIREVLPPSREAFAADRTAREVVVLNLFVAIQDCVALASHWLADSGIEVPESYARVLVRLGERDVVDIELAQRLAAATGLRNLIAHRYGAIDADRIYEVAATRLDDLLAFCDALKRKSEESP